MKHNQFEEQEQELTNNLAIPVMGSSEPTPNQTPSSLNFSSSLNSPSTSSTSTTDQEDSNMATKNKNTKSCTKAKFAYRIRDHVKMGPKFSETVKGKLSLGAKIIKKGGRENIFKQVFGMTEGEKLLKASQCYLSTTAGPIAGILFISTQKIAFCSERSITVPSPNGESVKKPYKVMIPTKKVKRASESENIDHPTQKYIEIVTEDNFEFWFMGFVRYEKAFNKLQKAISMSDQSIDQK